MSYFGILLALIVPLCQASPIGYYMSRDFEPPAYQECPGPRDGYYMDPYGNCGLYVECMYVGTSMEMAWVMPCLPGSRFQYPSVCEECGKKNANEDKINARVVPPRVSSEQQDEFDKSTPTTTLRPTTPTPRPSAEAITGKQVLTQKSTVAEQTTGVDTTMGRAETTIKGRSPQEEASTHMFTQTSGHQVSENDVTTKSLPGKTTKESNEEMTTAAKRDATIEVHVQTTSSEATGTTESKVVKSEPATTGTTMKMIAETSQPSTERRQTDETTAIDNSNTSPVQETSSFSASKETATPQPQESGTTASQEPEETVTSRSAVDATEMNTMVPVKNDRGETTTGAKITDQAETTGTTAANQPNSPDVRVTFVSSDAPQTTAGRSEESLQNPSSNNPEKDIDSSRSNVIEVTANVIKSALLSELSDLSDLKTTTVELEYQTTSSIPSQAEESRQS